ncbi:hypothetical protein [Variovorax sp. tm]|uniref:hypothetical protein n=1 Tax=Variovorax atrisoli TaxID=3394203 RepID=UPI003A7FCEB5
MRTIEFTLFGMLLAHMTPQEQVQELLRRGDSLAQLVSFEDEFQQLLPPEAQEQLAGLATTDDRLLPVLWYAITQEKPASGSWLPLIDRALTNSSSVVRGFALELLFRMPKAAVRKRLGLLELSVDPTPLEKHWFTRILLQHSTETPSTLINRCDFATCAEALGTVAGERQRELATAFAGHVLAWLQLQVDECSVLLVWHTGREGPSLPSP